MHNLPFDTTNLSADDVDTLNETYSALKEKFEISLDGKIDLDINNFDLLRCNPDSSIGGVLTIKNPVTDCYLAFIKIHYSEYGMRSVTRDDYYRYKVWGVVNLKRDFGRILIRRETFTDKVVGLIHPVELEFKDDKAFDDKFYVVTNDENKAAAAMNGSFRNAIMDITHDDVIIEIAGNTLIIGNDSLLDAQDAIYFAEIACKIASVR